MINFLRRRLYRIWRFWFGRCPRWELGYKCKGLECEADCDWSKNGIK